MTVKWEGDTDVVHGIEPFAHVSPVLEKWGYDARFVDPMIDMVGDSAPELYTEKLNLKRPFHGGVNPVHQDYPYWVDGSKDATRIATAMLFLDAADRENGCMEVLPGSHLRGKWPTRNDTDPFGNLRSTRGLRGAASSCRSRCPPGRSSTSARSSSTGPRRTVPPASAARCSTAISRRAGRPPSSSPGRCSEKRPSKLLGPCPPDPSSRSRCCSRPSWLRRPLPAPFITDAQGRALILHGANVSGSAKNHPERLPWVDPPRSSAWPTTSASTSRAI